MDDRLLEEIAARLDSDLELDEEVRWLIDAALLDELDNFLEGKSVRRRPTPTKPVEELPGSLYAGAIRVRGFRGIGPEARLELAPGPGLTLVIGRNGSGKSSFSEGMELLLTGDNRRWARRTKEWQSGFRNIHGAGSAQLEADLLIEGEGKAVIRRSWGNDDALEEGKLSLKFDDRVFGSVDEVGWSQPLQSYRPFLSYNEMGSILDQGPSRLFDSLDPILGLADLGEAADRLKVRKKELKTLEKEVKDRLKELKDVLEKLEDERAVALDKALKGRKWKLDEVAEIIGRDMLSEDTSISARLGQLSQLPGPSLEEVGLRVSELKEALEQKSKVGGDGERTHRLMVLLEQAIEFQEATEDETCPICGAEGALHPSWSDHTKARIEAIRSEAEAAAVAQKEIDRILELVRRSLSDPPTILQEGTDLGLDLDGTQSAWMAWASLQEASSETMVEQIESRTLDLAAAVERIRRRAQERRQDLEREWSDLALQLQEWLPSARQVMEQAERVRQLTAAEKKLLEETQAIRNDRFAPIEAKVLRFWELLRARSSVDIGGLALSGARTRRKVDIEVEVDGSKAAALGVMSQGELHALVLSLFLPRATMEESPFGFLLIDDPVQAMDLSRVDGLAKVLEEVSRTHQVVVFSHDNRLPEATRRLGISARVLKVERKPNSEVTVEPVSDPVKQCLDDAFALQKTPNLPEEAAKRVIPALCRQALEAACVEVIWRRGLAAGKRHHDLEKLLRENKTLIPKLALALTDHSKSIDEAMRKLKRRVSHQAPEIIRQCNQGAHGQWSGKNLHGFIQDVQAIAREIRRTS